MNKIHAIILDVDGVIVGDKVGVNYPHPHPEVIEKLRAVKSSGIPIILCTAKPHYTIQKIIEDANLNNFHVSDGGAYIFNPKENVIAAKFVVSSTVSPKIISNLYKLGTYLEFYSPNAYFAQKDQICDLTEIHTTILQTSPKIVTSLESEISNHDVTKIMPIARTDDEKNAVSQVINKFENDITLVWSKHPIAYPVHFGVITKKGVSKKNSARLALEKSDQFYGSTLGVGDSSSDWVFMEACGYVGAMGNATEELKHNVASRKEFGFIGLHVNANGVLHIFDHFLK